MTDEDRINMAFEYARSIRSHLILAMEAPDPVERRKHLVLAAQQHRHAADLLDDHGALTE